MMRRTSIEPVFVDAIPDTLKDGALYISLPHRTAIHLCCCGCGKEVVTPLGKANWTLHKNAEGTIVSLTPSIGNWNFTCRSHYFIRQNRIQWAGAFNQAQIRRVQQKDFADASAEATARNRQRALHPQAKGTPPANETGIVAAVMKCIRWIKSLF